MYEFDYERIAADAAAERLKSLKKHGPKGERRPKRRADGEGSIFEVQRTRKDGTTATYIWATRTVDIYGERRKFSAQAATAAEAIDKRERKIMKVLVDAGIEQPDKLPPDPRVAGLTVADCLHDWLTERRSRNLAPATIGMYSSRIRNHLLPVFGDRIVHSLKYDELKRFFNHTLPAKGLGPDSIRQTFICLKSALDHYYNDELMHRRPLGSLQPPAKKRKTKDEIDDIRQVSKYISSYLLDEARKIDQEARWAMALFGLRQGEALGMTDASLLRWEEENNGGRVRIDKQLQRIMPEHGCGVVSGTGEFRCGKQSTECPQRSGEVYWTRKPTKSASGERDIIVDRAMWKMLLAHRAKQRKLRRSPDFAPEPGKGLDTLLFTRPDGKPIYPQRDRDELVAMLKNIRLPAGMEMTVHTLRAISTTMLVESGTNRDELVSMMGWSPKSADAQIATYSSADMARLAAATTVAFSEQLRTQGRRAKTVTVDHGADMQHDGESV